MKVIVITFSLFFLVKNLSSFPHPLQQMSFLEKQELREHNFCYEQLK